MSILGNPILMGGNGGGGGANIQPLSVTQNGTYTASGGVDGYSPVVVSVSGGGGSVNILSGTKTPTAEQGSNGNTYLQYGNTVNYIKLSIFAVRSSGSGMQLSLVNLLDDNDTVVAWPSGTTVTSNKPAYASGEGPDKLLSNVNTKYYTSYSPSTNSPIEIVFALGSPVSFSKWKWYTANDETSRDPKSFALSVSANGTDYTELDRKTTTPTTARKALAYTSSTLLVPAESIIGGAYAKVGGAWQPLIGTDIHDVDLGGGGASDPAALFDILADCYALNSSAGYNILSSMYVSHTVGDRMAINGRYFQRDTAIPALIVNQTSSEVGSRGYVVYSPSQDAFSGTYSEYGSIGYSTTLTSPSGNTFYQKRMNSPWVTSTKFDMTISNGGNTITTLKANDFLLNYNLNDSAMVSLMGRIMDALFF